MPRRVIAATDLAIRCFSEIHFVPINAVRLTLDRKALSDSR